MMNDTVVLEGPIKETIQDIIRMNSNKISNIHNDICVFGNFINGSSIERNVECKEPACLFEELLWQRSMLCRIEEEIYNLSQELGVGGVSCND